jgi:hypothetical protein
LGCQSQEKSTETVIMQEYCWRIHWMQGKGVWYCPSCEFTHVAHAKPKCLHYVGGFWNGTGRVHEMH